MSPEPRPCVVCVAPLLESPKNKTLRGLARATRARRRGVCLAPLLSCRPRARNRRRLVAGVSSGATRPRTEGFSGLPAFLSTRRLASLSQWLALVVVAPERGCPPVGAQLVSWRAARVSTLCPHCVCAPRAGHARGAHVVPGVPADSRRRAPAASSTCLVPVAGSTACVAGRGGRPVAQLSNRWLLSPAPGTCPQTHRVRSNLNP